MGLIKEGTISGRLPSKEVFAVHYPGYPSSTDRALETLGGTEAISKAVSSESNKLELRFRPEDPYSHPVFGRMRSCNNFLLKISRAKSSSREDATSSARPVDPTCSNQTTCDTAESERDGLQGSKRLDECADGSGGAQDQISLSADIVACVSKAYHFDGMADYQHVLPVHAHIAQTKKRNWTEMEPHFDKGGLMDIDQEDVMILVPPLFSLKDMPEHLVLKKPSTLSSSKRKQEETQTHQEMDIEPCLAIDFNVKEIPREVKWEEYIPSDQRESYMAVSSMFDERPIWPKSSLAERLLDKGLKLGGHLLKRILYVIGYYFSNGPFIRFWIRRGYDPRKDPNSCIYQSVDFRTPPPLRSYCDANAAKGLKHRWEDICAFRVFPYKCQTTLQLCELEDDYIQQEIRKAQKQANCTCGTGWFSPRLIESFRRRVALRFLSVYPEIGAEHLLKAASDRFEKSKRMYVRESTSKHDANKNQQDDTGPK